MILYPGRQKYGARPGECEAVRYLPRHGSYVMACIQQSGNTDSRMSYYWAPHPWGPWWPTYNSFCQDLYFTGPSNNTKCTGGFISVMAYGENIVSTTPPVVQARVSANSGTGGGRDDPEGAPNWNTIQFMYYSLFFLSRGKNAHESTFSSYFKKNLGSCSTTILT